MRTILPGDRAVAPRARDPRLGRRGRGERGHAGLVHAGHRAARTARCGRDAGAIAAHLGTGDRRKLAALLEDLARDERIMAVEVCTPALATVSRTKAFPERFSCEGLRARALQGALPAGLDFSDEIDGGRVHVSIHPLEDEGTIRAALVLVHDLSFVARRERAMRHVTLAAFAFVALLASILTVVVRRASWRSWTDELRSVLSIARWGGSAPGHARGMRSSRCSPTCAGSSPESRRRSARRAWRHGRRSGSSTCCASTSRARAS